MIHVDLPCIRELIAGFIVALPALAFVINRYNTPVMEELAAALEHLEWFVDEGDDARLRSAVSLIESSTAKPSEVLDAVESLRGEPEYKARAVIAVRKVLGLSLVPGPVCRR